MQAGRLDRLVTLQSRTVTRNGSGEEITTYADLAQVWAEKVELRGREFYSADQARADISTRWRIRRRDDVTVLHRLVYEGREYDIEHVAELGRRVGLELYTVARVP